MPYDTIINIVAGIAITILSVFLHPYLHALGAMLFLRKADIKLDEEIGARNYRVKVDFKDNDIKLQRVIAMLLMPQLLTVVLVAYATITENTLFMAIAFLNVVISLNDIDATYNIYRQNYNVVQNTIIVEPLK